MTDEKEWLASLKPGDKVIISGRYDNEIRTVYRRTPSGRIIVSIGGMSTREYNPDGYERGKSDSWSRTYLVAPTPERLERIEERSLFIRLRDAKWDRTSLDKMRRIVAILDEE